MGVVYLLFVLLMGITSSVSPTELIIPKEVQSLTPIQKQYEYLLIAFRQSLGVQKNDISQLQEADEPSHTKGFASSLSLSEQTQTEMAIELMAQLDTPNYDVANGAIFSPDTWQSLRLVDKEPSALSGIAPDMKTIFGKIFLARLLTTPTIDIQRITARQEAIQELCNNPKATQKIIDLCSDVQQVQEQLLGLTSKDHPLYDKGLRIYQHEFFFRSFGPRSKKVWNRVAKLFGDLWYTAGLVALPVLNIQGIIGYGKKSTAEIEQKFGIGSGPMVAAGLALLTAYNASIQLPGIVTWIRERFRAMDYFYQTLYPLRVFFITTQKLKNHLASYPKLACLSDEIDAALTLNHTKTKKLRDLIMGRAFKSRFSAHKWGGDLILVIDLLRECRGNLLKGIGLIGALDTYSSLASWYTAYNNHAKKPLCFAQFKRTVDKPFIKIADFWHVLSRGNPRLNSLQLGSENPQNAIITGIFESGKSTILQSVALNVVCAQSIGICLARSYSATPYASINIYANIKDDLANNRSLFKTELYRALQLLEQIKRLPAGRFSFTIADATFTGTEAGAGQAAAYAVARYLGELPNSIALHATNFLSLSILGKQEPGHFTNYILPTIFDGKTIQTYTLTPGTQDPQLSTAIFKEEKLPMAMITEIEAQLASIGA
ncbi:MAG: mismatch repair protein MutS [Candidatus Dependentiae bacterium]|nr:mismatch repair protein MutS [Candidatus Dependentiae bacterium]